MRFNDRVVAECPVCKRTFKTAKGAERHERTGRCAKKNDAADRWAGHYGRNRHKTNN